jgi:hypothetical protein
MEVEVLIPITLFVCIAYSIKVIAEARMRNHLARSGASDELLRSMIEGEERARRYGSLRWGVTLVALGVGFGLIEFFHWHDLTAGTIAVLVGATGLGNLAFYAMSRRLK